MSGISLLTIVVFNLFIIVNGQVYNVSYTTKPELLSIYVTGHNVLEESKNETSWSEKNKILLTFNVIGIIINVMTFMFSHRKYIIKKYWSCCKGKFSNFC